MKKIIKSSIEIGKKDAERLITDEQIDYDPFIAISDLHLVRKTVPISFDSFRETISDMDSQLWSSIEASVNRLADNQEEPFDLDAYAEGFSEGVAAVWEKIRNDVL
ncbi:MAG: hypothetical protein ACR2PB_05890 [Desulfocapsaceae bacterium]